MEKKTIKVNEIFKRRYLLISIILTGLLLLSFFYKVKIDREEDEDYLTVYKPTLNLCEMRIINTPNFEYKISTKGDKYIFCRIAERRTSKLKFMDELINLDSWVNSMSLEGMRGAHIFRNIKVKYIDTENKSMKFTIDFKGWFSIRDSMGKWMFKFEYLNENNGNLRYIYLEEEEIASLLKNSEEEIWVNVIWDIQNEQIIFENENQSFIINLIDGDLDRECNSCFESLLCPPCEGEIPLMEMYLEEVYNQYYYIDSDLVKGESFVFDGKSFRLGRTMGYLTYSTLFVDDVEYQTWFTTFPMERVLQNPCYEYEDEILVGTYVEIDNIVYVIKPFKCVVDGKSYYAQYIYKLGVPVIDITLYRLKILLCGELCEYHDFAVKDFYICVHNASREIEIKWKRGESIFLPITEEMINIRLIIMWNSGTNEFRVIPSTD